MTSAGYESSASLPPPDGDLRERVCTVTGCLTTELRALLDALTDGNPRPAVLSTATGLDKSLSARIVRAVREASPIAAAAQIPSPEGLRMLCAAAVRRVDGNLHSRALAAVSKFDELIRREIGDHSTFRVMVAGWLPDARQKLERESKYNVYKGMRQILGYEADVSVSAYLLQPSVTPGRADNVIVHGFTGWRRLRAGVPLPNTYASASRALAPEAEPWTPAALDADVLPPGRSAFALTQFCSHPLPDYEQREIDGVWQYRPKPLQLGRHGACTFYFAQRHVASNQLYAAPGQDVETLGVLVGIPTRVLLLDALLHEDVWSGSVPQLFTYRLGARGLVKDEELSERATDRLELVERIEIMPPGLAALELRDVPRYAEMLAHVFGRLDWSPARFRCFRLRMEYPIAGSQMIMAFKLCQPPPHGTTHGPQPPVPC